jgi:hypothetical protein
MYAKSVAHVHVFAHSKSLVVFTSERWMMISIYTPKLVVTKIELRSSPSSTLLASFWRDGRFTVIFVVPKHCNVRADANLLQSSWKEHLRHFVFTVIFTVTIIIENVMVFFMKRRDFLAPPAASGERHSPVPKSLEIDKSVERFLPLLLR